MKKLIIILILFSAVGIVYSKRPLTDFYEKQTLQTVHDSKFTELLDSLRDAENLPALASAIVSDSGIINAEAVGCRRSGGAENVTNNDQFHLGSNTKAFTAVLIGMLVDESLLTWDTTLLSIFPEYSGIMHPEYRSVTVRDLLSHSAGFIANPSVTLKSNNVKDQRTEVVVWALMQPPACTRGQFLYSNLGFIIAGAIIDKITNRTYEDLLMERVIKPLGITTAGFGPMGTVGLEDQPLQHSAEYKPVEPDANADNPPIYNSAGRLHMSVGDWGKYIQWVLACESGNVRLLKPETARTLTKGVTPMPGEGMYALGWTILDRPWANGRVLTHSGSNTMNFAVAWLAPNRKFAVLAETNICAGTTPGAMDAVIGRLIKYYLNEK